MSATTPIAGRALDQCFCGGRFLLMLQISASDSKFGYFAMVIPAAADGGLTPVFGWHLRIYETELEHWRELRRRIQPLCFNRFRVRT